MGVGVEVCGIGGGGIKINCSFHSLRKTKDESFATLTTKDESLAVLATKYEPLTLFATNRGCAATPIPWPSVISVGSAGADLYFVFVFCS